MARGQSKKGPTSGSRPKAPPKFCSHCGSQVNPSGPDSKDGQRYCMKAACRAAKARRERARAAAFKDDRDAPATCAYCGDPRPKRKWRAGDELGRCCRKVSCRRKRDAERAEAGIDRIPDLVRQNNLLENAVMLLSEAVLADQGDKRMICKECGLTTALSGWHHRRADDSPCKGTLGENPLRRPVSAVHLDMAWPFEREYLARE